MSSKSYYKHDSHNAKETMRFNNEKELAKTDFDFKEFIMLNLNYPEIKDLIDYDETLVVEVDLTFEIDQNNIPINIKIPEQRNLIPRTASYEKELIKSDIEPFASEAIKMIRDFKFWNPHKLNSKYVNISFFKTIYFTYHSDYFSNENELTLNPDIKPTFDKKTKKYEQILKCKYGCDGIINLSCIVDKVGRLKKINTIGVGGKISQAFAIKELISLGNLKPAIKGNKPVETQLDLIIYI